jgi:hypothetical protein
MCTWFYLLNIVLYVGFSVPHCFSFSGIFVLKRSLFCTWSLAYRYTRALTCLSSRSWVSAVIWRIRCTQPSGLHKIRLLSSRCHFESISSGICLCYAFALCTLFPGCVELSCNRCLVLLCIGWCCGPSSCPDPRFPIHSLFWVVECWQ